MVKEFWQSVFIFVAFWVIVFIYVQVTTSKPTNSNSATKTLLKNQNYSLNLDYPDDARECLRRYKSKLEEYEIAIREAQNYLDGTYKGYADSCNEKIDAALEKLDIDLSSPSCY